MALKIKITKEIYDTLPADIKSEYVESEDGYRLDVAGVEDSGALKRAKDRESQLRKDAEKELRELKEKLDALDNEDARKKGDIATLEKAWHSKLEAQKSDYESKLEKSNGFIKRSLVDAKAIEIATKISTKPNLIMPHVKARLLADMDGDVPTTRILDKNGKVCEMTIEQLEAEFIANDDFSTIIKGSMASGGATKPTSIKTPSSSAGQGSNKSINLNSASNADLVAYLKSKKEATTE